MPEAGRGHGTLPTPEDLARHWDTISRGQTTDPSALDGELTAAIRQFHELAARDRESDPDPRFVRRLMDDLAKPASAIHLPPYQLTLGHPGSPNGTSSWSHAGGEYSRPTMQRPRELGQFATAAVVALTLVVSFFFFAFRPAGIIRQNQQPVALPAISGTPAPLVPPGTPIAEVVWQLDGGPGLPFHDPTALAFAPDGNLWVPDGSSDRFQIFTPDGDFLEVWGQPGSEEGKFNLSLGGYGYGAVTWDAEGNIYVADSGNFRIQKFAPDRTFITSWGSRGEEDGQFLELNNLFLDRDGRLHATDHERDDIQVFDTDGALLGVWSEPGFLQGQLQNPGSVAQDAAGNFYVNEFLNHRIQKISPDGVALSTIGEMGSGDGQFTNPTDVILDARGHFFVVDYGNHRIQAFDADGRFLGAFGEMGFDEGQFVNPIFAVLDGEGFIYVSDEGSDRVQKFRLLPPLAS